MTDVVNTKRGMVKSYYQLAKPFGVAHGRHSSQCLFRATGVGRSIRRGQNQILHLPCSAFPKTGFFRRGRFSTALVSADRVSTDHQRHSIDGQELKVGTHPISGQRNRLPSFHLYPLPPPARLPKCTRRLPAIADFPIQSGILHRHVYMMAKSYVHGLMQSS